MDNGYGNVIMSGIFSVICTIASWFFGGFDGAIRLLIALVITDYVLGIIAAGVNHELDSWKGFTGIFRKVIIFALVGVVNVVGRELMGNGTGIRDLVIYFYVANEGISIIENADKAHVPIPKGITRIFEKLQESGDMAVKQLDKEKQV